MTDFFFIDSCQKIFNLLLHPWPKHIPQYHIPPGLETAEIQSSSFGNSSSTSFLKIYFINQSINNQQINQSVNHKIKSTKQPTNQATNQPNNQPTKRETNQPPNQSFDKPLNQPTKQPFNRSTN